MYNLYTHNLQCMPKSLKDFHWVFIACDIKFACNVIPTYSRSSRANARSKKPIRGCGIHCRCIIIIWLWGPNDLTGVETEINYFAIKHWPSVVYIFCKRSTSMLITGWFRMNIGLNSQDICTFLPIPVPFYVNIRILS